MLSSFGVLFIGLPWYLAFPLTPKPKRGRMSRWLLGWSGKGLFVPLLIWGLMNLGLSWHLQPFMPAVQKAQLRGGNWAPAYLEAFGSGLLIIGSYWCAITLAWIVNSAARAAEDSSREYLKRLCWVWAMRLSIPAGIVLWRGGLASAGIAATVCLVPIAFYGSEILQPKMPPPFYSRALTRIKSGKYEEGEWEIIAQLENWEDDFEGWMLLADLYANHFKNIAEAEETVFQLCEQPKTSHSQISIALHRLADWQLKLAHDPNAARRALNLICRRLPGTHLAHMAQLRIDRLPGTAEELQKQERGLTIAIPVPGDQLDTAPVVRMGRAQATNLADSYAELLKQNPGYVAAREKLARTLAEHLGQPKVAIEHLSMLLKTPGRAESERAEWLSLVADWQIKYCHDLESGQKSLQQLIREYPHSPQAVAAKQRLGLLAPRLKG